VIGRKIHKDSRVDASLSYGTVAKKKKKKKKQKSGPCWKHKPTQAKKVSTGR
jgi:hypothetical protein